MAVWQLVHTSDGIAVLSCDVVDSKLWTEWHWVQARPRRA
jgi:hypothetical protein